MNITDLRAVVDLIEGDPLLREQRWYTVADGLMTAAWNAEDVAPLVRALRGTIDSPVRKRRLVEDDPTSALMCERRIGTVVVAVWDYTANENQTCERVQVGTRVEQVAVAFEEREVPVFEWRCAPVLVGDITQERDG